MRAWEAARAARVQQLADGVGPLDLDVVKKRARDAAGDAWCDKMDAEVEYLGKRRFINNLERVLDGTALPIEIDDCSKGEAAALNNLHIAQRKETIEPGTSPCGLGAPGADVSVWSLHLLPRWWRGRVC